MNILPRLRADSDPEIFSGENPARVIESIRLGRMPTKELNIAEIWGPLEAGTFDDLIGALEGPAH